MAGDGSGDGESPGVTPTATDLRRLVAGILEEAVARRDRFVRYADVLHLLLVERDGRRDFVLSRKGLHLVEAVAATERTIVAAAVALECGLRGAEQTPPPAA